MFHIRHRSSQTRHAFVRTVEVVLAQAVTYCLVGLEPRRVEVEAHLQRAVPAFAIVGLADRACQEAKERVRSGVASAQLEWPRFRITDNLAAAGGHNLLLAGPPGTGKTMLGRRLPGILPPLAPEEALEVTRIHSVAGLLSPEHPLVLAAPFRAPHHSASTAAIVGGGPGPRPGEASLAHRGVLLLDEMPEFQRPALEALRQPLEDGFINIARAGGRALFPARFQLVATMNLCPCGGRGDPRAECSCSAQRLAAFRDKLSRALLDRFDLVVTVPRPRAVELAAAGGEASAAVAPRVAAGRERLAAGGLERTRAADELLARAVERVPLSARGRAKVGRVARTAAALAGAEGVAAEHVAEALAYRVPAELAAA